MQAGIERLKLRRLTLLLGALAVPHATDAFSAARMDSPAGQGNSDELVQLAQAYDFDVYIDQYGREVIVDPRTGEIVEVRPLTDRRPPPPPPEPSRTRESRRDYYDLTDPRDVERFYRDREAAIARGWDGPGAQGFPEYGEEPYDQRNRGGYEVFPPAEPRYEVYPPEQEDRSVRRAPLEPPFGDERDTAAMPPDSGMGAADPDSDDVRERRQDTPSFDVPGARGAKEEVAAFQVLLDRVGASPGVIDGQIGDNVNRAIEAYHRLTGQRLRTYDPEWVEAELEKTGGPAFVEYTITAEDAAGPYIASVPQDYGEKAKLERLGYTRVSEMLAERFHMAEDYLIALNPNANFDRPGTIIKVVNPGEPIKEEVARIVADKGRKQVRAYNERGKLLSTYPATIGSVDTPSPSGTHEVERIAFDPEYTYDPRKNFKQGNNDRVLTIPPGPNGPVGTIWIALSKPTYGIHGTPDPSKIGKTSSHGCIRLTNWDAKELAENVKPGVSVEFVE
ncbi:L,D-transpeptidase [Chelativorans sp. YIM 93263]|uniref:L,D-transpeptidase n=1 Tax=Chelativorans sp. YIM 93263 TaxID=2906648 RepID=UPI002378B345|nr:L,D-transpeptidase [Chelativorans sp. YIM 93263]